MRDCNSDKARKPIGEICYGLDYWFAFIIHPGMEPPNNRAKRALRKHVILRMIFETLRNGKGMTIHERIMTVLATWGTAGAKSFQML